ncbi:MAG: DMP19 family protein [Candidatus Rokuibacteriota bacterium]
MKARAPAADRMARLFRQLTKLPARGRAVAKLKMRLERLLMRLVTAEGLPAVDAATVALNARGRRLRLVGKHRAGRKWREDLEAGRTLEIDVIAGQFYRSTHVDYRVVREPRLTPRQRVIRGLQEAFYSRYMAVGQKAYGDPRHRPTPPDRLVLLIGELEADVNNGGFDQYLINKGRRRARAALAALRAVGARKTAGMLAKAMAPRATPAELAALDERFYRVPEDLAVFTARHVKL